MILQLAGVFFFRGSEEICGEVRVEVWFKKAGSGDGYCSGGVWVKKMIG